MSLAGSTKNIVAYPLIRMTNRSGSDLSEGKNVVKLHCMSHSFCLRFHHLNYLKLVENDFSPTLMYVTIPVHFFVKTFFM